MFEAVRAIKEVLPIPEFDHSGLTHENRRGVKEHRESVLADAEQNLTSLRPDIFMADETTDSTEPGANEQSTEIDDAFADSVVEAAEQIVAEAYRHHQESRELQV